VLFYIGFVLREGNSISIEEFFKTVESIMNQEIFGSVGCSSNWKFPINDDGTMGKIKLTNWRARRIINQIESLVEACLPGEQRIEE
jgi:hypothetical protein